MERELLVLMMLSGLSRIVRENLLELSRGVAGLSELLEIELSGTSSLSTGLTMMFGLSNDWMGLSGITRVSCFILTGLRLRVVSRELSLNLSSLSWFTLGSVFILSLFSERDLVRYKITGRCEPRLRTVVLTGAISLSGLSSHSSLR